MLRRIVVANSLVIALASLSVAAPLTVTNGDFETAPGTSIGGGNGNQNISGWFDSSANFSSFYFGSSVAVAASISDTGWIYQSLGNYDPADGSMLTWSVDAVNSNTSNGAGNPFEIDYFSGPFGAAAENVDIAGTLTAFASDSFSDSGTPTEDLLNASGTIDLSGLTLGDEVWVRFQGGNFDGIDNFSVQQFAVPEPASIAIWSLIGLSLGGFGYYRARRKIKA